jgi:hypothetical protein
MLLHEWKLFPVDYCGIRRRKRINNRLGIASWAIQYFSEILNSELYFEWNQLCDIVDYIDYVMF